MNVLTGTTSAGMGSTVIMLVLMIAIFYFMLIRPENKRKKEAEQMRGAVKKGDKIVTIGGICGKIVKTKEDSFIIQVGADKVKFEMMRWAVSSVTKPSARREDRETVVEDEAPKKAMPKKLRKSSDVEETAKEDAPVSVTEVEKAAAEEAASEE